MIRNDAASLTTGSELWLIRAHSPNTEQSIVCSTRQEIVTIAIGRSCGGKAQGRHSSGVACELLQREQQWQRVGQLSHVWLVDMTTQNSRPWSNKSTNMNINQLFKQETHPVNLLGVQVPHLDYLTSWKQQFAIRAHTQTCHCCTVGLPLTVKKKKKKNDNCLCMCLCI